MTELTVTAMPELTSNDRTNNSSNVSAHLARVAWRRERMRAASGEPSISASIRPRSSSSCEGAGGAVAVAVTVPDGIIAVPDAIIALQY